MVRVCSRILCFVLAVVSAGLVHASPMYYTFQGTAFDVVDGAGASGISVGDEISYVYLIDFARGGTVVNLDGIERTVVESFSTYEFYPYDPLLMDNFYVDYQSGSAYFGANGLANDFLELNAGLNNHDPVLEKYMITGGDAVGVASFTKAVQDWLIGDEFFSFNGWGSEGDHINGLVTLVDIYNPPRRDNLPEPAPIALLGLGLVGLVVSRYKKSNARGSCGLPFVNLK